MTDTVLSDPSLMSVDYYRQKVLEFQQVLNDLDSTYMGLALMQEVAYETNDQDMIDETDTLISTLQGKLSEFRMVGQGIQLASQGINAVGVDFPTVTIPGSLGVVPLIPLAAAAAVVASAIALIYWAKGFWQTVDDFLMRYQTSQAIASLPTDQQAAALSQMQQLSAQVKTARASAETSPLSSLADIGKWLILGGLLYVGVKMLKDK